ncbi:MAG: 6,7-dimethyl-8-ribityllumazine synthase [Actinobacteria bacterium]|jgi:6,7-dimethyl-8-ribityllumazine synthase|nr:6,7-dimethyl-8-ribityllumazine synthase [Actinomycetota bacterium]
MKDVPSIPVDARGMRAAVVASAYHGDVTGAMVEGARRAFVAAGGLGHDVRVMPAAGAFELPVLVDALLGRGDVDLVVAIGCIVRGETSHDRVLGQAVTSELARISVARGKPVGLAVLTVDSLEQARARAGGALGNKGEEAMRAAVATARTLMEVRR